MILKISSINNIKLKPVTIAEPIVIKICFDTTSEISSPSNKSSLFYAFITMPEASGRTMMSAAPMIVPPPKIAILFMMLGGAVMQLGRYPHRKVPRKSAKKIKNAASMSPMILESFLYYFSLFL